MRRNGRSVAPNFVIGVMFIVVGISSSRGLVVAGIVFLIAAFASHRQSQISGGEPEEVDDDNDRESRQLSG